jgi:arginyl-tRNA synthetase
MVSPDDYSESEMDEFVYAHSPYKTDIQNAAFVAILKGYDFSSLETEFTEEFKRHMRDLYNRLEVEYDALTSDESVLESLHANDMLDEIIDELENEYA